MGLHGEVVDQKWGDELRDLESNDNKLSSTVDAHNFGGLGDGENLISDLAMNVSFDFLEG